MEFRRVDLDDFDNGIITYEQLVERHNAYLESLENNDDEDEITDEEVELDKTKDKKEELDKNDKNNDKTSDIKDEEYLKYLELKKKNKIIIKKDDDSEESTLETFISEYNININKIKDKKTALTDESAEAVLRDFYKNKDMDEDDITNLIEKVIANNALISKASSLLDKEIATLEANKEAATETYKKNQEAIKLKKEQEAIAIAETMRNNLSKTKVFGEALTEKETKTLSDEILANPTYFDDLFAKDPSLFYKIIIAINKGYFTENGLNKIIKRNAHIIIKDDEDRPGSRRNNSRTTSNNP